MLFWRIQCRATIYAVTLPGHRLPQQLLLAQAAHHPNLFRPQLRRQVIGIARPPLLSRRKPAGDHRRRDLHVRDILFRLQFRRQPRRLGRGQ